MLNFRLIHWLGAENEQGQARSKVVDFSRFQIFRIFLISGLLVPAPAATMKLLAAQNKMHVILKNIACMHACLHASMQACKHTSMQACININSISFCMHTNRHAGRRGCLIAWTCIAGSICACKHYADFDGVCVRVCLCLCVCVYVLSSCVHVCASVCVRSWVGLCVSCAFSRKRVSHSMVFGWVSVHFYIASSTSPPRGSQVDGLPRVASACKSSGSSLSSEYEFFVRTGFVQCTISRKTLEKMK